MNITFNAVVNSVYRVGDRWMADLLVDPKNVPVLEGRVLEAGASMNITPFPGRLLWAGWEDVMTIPLDGLNADAIIAFNALRNRPVVVEAIDVNDE